MTAKFPAFQFYPDDFLGSGKVAQMTAEEVGAYILLLCLDWNDDGFEHDPARLARVCRVRPKRFAAMWDGCLARCFAKGEDGRWRNARLQRERTKQQEFREKSALGGKRSAESRASVRNAQVVADQHPDPKGGSTTLAVGLQANANIPVTSYQLPVTENPPSPPSGGKKPRPKADDTRPDVAEVVAHYTTRHPRRSVSLKARRLVARVLDSGWGVADCCAAIDGNADDAWHAEKRKHELEYVLRDDKRDGFREMGERRDAGADVEPPNFLGCDIADVDRWLAAHPGYAA